MNLFFYHVICTEPYVIYVHLLLQDFKLDASFIYTLVGRQCARQLQYASIRQLLGCIKDSGISSEAVSDEVIAACVRVIADQTGEVRFYTTSYIEF